MYQNYCEFLFILTFLLKYFLITAALCPDLAPINNGFIIYSPDSGGPYNSIGTMATHECDQGYALTGSETRTCLMGGVFSGTESTCDGTYIYLYYYTYHNNIILYIFIYL